MPCDFLFALLFNRGPIDVDFRLFAGINSRANNYRLDAEDRLSLTDEKKSCTAQEEEKEEKT